MKQTLLSFDLTKKHATAFNTAFNEIPAFDGTYSGWRTGIDVVTNLQLEKF
jgi:hypothetical protein